MLSSICKLTPYAALNALQSPEDKHSDVVLLPLLFEKVRSALTLEEATKEFKLEMKELSDSLAKEKMAANSLRAQVRTKEAELSAQKNEVRRLHDEVQKLSIYKTAMEVVATCLSSVRPDALRYQSAEVLAHKVIDECDICLCILISCL
jgi:hypothetical protein